MSGPEERIRLEFVHQPDLAATMDIQIPALAWQPESTSGGFRRVFYLDGAAVPVTVVEDDHALTFTTAVAHPALPELLRAIFPQQIADLSLGDDPLLVTLQRQYAGVVVMWADPFDALILTVLSQNRTGEIVRRVYPQLAVVCGGITPDSLAALDRDVLRATIRSAGPYKTDRLAALARAVGDTGHDAFAAHVLTAPTDQALALLTALPGVGHKTAACVLVFSARTTATLPVDVHLFRVADRLGLAPHNGKLGINSRDSVIAALLTHSPQLALAHFLFLLVGRTTCVAGVPACGSCFLRTGCAHAQRSRAEDPVSTS